MDTDTYIRSNSLQGLGNMRSYQTLSSYKADAILTQPSNIASGPKDALRRLGSRRFGPLPLISDVFKQKCGENDFKGSWVQQNLQFSSILDLLPGTKNATALVPTDGRQPLSHGQLKAVVAHEFPKALATMGVTPNSRLGLVLPNGPEMAVCLVGCTVSVTCAPINAQNTHEEIIAELQNVGAAAVIIAGGDALPASDLRDDLGSKLTDAGLRVIELLPSETISGLFTLRDAKNPHVTHTMTGFPPAIKEVRVHASVTPVTFEPLGRHATALVLHTSGTSGKKKVVPYSVETLAVGAALVIASWDLGAEDVGLNMMPLFHVGGIVRNVLAPLLSGGATVPCRAFDATQFWDLLESTGATWYFAAPTMHHMILEEGKGRTERRNAIRMVCNAAGGLLPSLAKELQYRFGGAAVLPSYGMTECMPIASPPADYPLDRPGTSGKAVGPDLQICDGAGIPLPAGTVGNIAVRGPPLFHGYEGDAEATTSSFFPGGWFNTGDMGYLDGDGYLYITGRSKEVINRGGEIISPFEIEQAVTSHPGIKETIAFSAPHEVLQEVVGVVLVSEQGHPRVDLQELQKHLGDLLHPAKWPVVAVYMDGVPTSAANKVLRVRLAERLGMADVNDALPQIGRLFEAKCPPKGAALSQKIPMTPLDVPAELSAAGDAIMRLAGKSRLADAGIALPRGAPVAYVLPTPGSKPWTEEESKALLERLDPALNAYIRPKSVVAVTDPHLQRLARTSDGALDPAELPAPAESREAALQSPTELAVAAAWSQVLDIPIADIGREADFFQLGGTSLAAGRMVAVVRKKFGVPLAAGAVFQNRTVAEFGEMLRGLLDSHAKGGPGQSGDKGSLNTRPSSNGGVEGGCAIGPLSVEHGDIESGFGDLLLDDEAEVAACGPKSQTSAAALVVQILPIFFFYPVSRISMWFLFTYYLSRLRTAWSTENMTGLDVAWVGLPQLLLAIAAIKITADIVLPICGILCKWVIIGRFKAGRYPFWGQYYLRWFLVCQILRISRMGMFRWFKGGKVWYYRLLGARIGRNVQFHDQATLGEFDLIAIGDNSWVDNATIRPFGLDRGTMLLREIRIGEDCVVCQKTSIAPGTRMPDGTVLPPCSSSYEMGDADPKYRDFCRVGFPGPNWRLKLLVGYPILLVGMLVRFFPWLASLFLYVNLPAFQHANTQTEILQWFGLNERLPFFAFLKVVRDCVCPFTFLAYVIIIKRNVVGRFKPGRRERSQWNLMRSWLMKNLMPGRDLGGVAGLVGPNFGVVSFVYRLLGAKVGKQVYWPGSGVYIEEIDLLDVGDHVVFGSRSEILGCDARDAGFVKLGAGCMVADRCVLLPGVTVGKGATLGSGTLAGKGVHFPPGSTWVGSSKGNATLWDLGNPKAAEAASTETPYARAITGHAKNYYCWPVWLHALVAYCCAVFVSAFHSLPILTVLALTVQWGQPWLKEDSAQDLLTIYGIMLALGIFSIIGVTLGALGLVILCKWIIIGRRKEGRHNWDDDSYNQRWQLMRRIEGLRSTGVGGRGPLNFLTGSAYLVWYFRALGAKIGKNVCLYPNSGDPMMTEPELVTLEDEVAVDDASLVAHINTKGEFSLNRLRVGRGATLRSHSRLLSGAAMEEHSMLLEHTLVLSGDIVDAHSIWQGWPARMVAAPPPPPEDGVELFAGH